MAIEMIPDDPPSGGLDNLPSPTINSELSFLDGPTETSQPETIFNEPIIEPPIVIEKKKRVKMSKAMKKSMDGLKSKVAEMPIMWFHDQARERPEWELDETEQALIRDSITTVFDVLDIEMEIQPLSYTLTSIWWVLGYPFVTFLFLFLIKKGKTLGGDDGTA
jgi:hypothetical protein